MGFGWVLSFVGFAGLMAVGWCCWCCFWCLVADLGLVPGLVDSWFGWVCWFLCLCCFTLLCWAVGLSVGFGLLWSWYNMSFWGFLVLTWCLVGFGWLLGWLVRPVFGFALCILICVYGVSGFNCVGALAYALVGASKRFGLVW